MNRLLAAVDKVGTPEQLGLPKVALDTGVERVITAMFVLIGALSVIFIIVGGLKYSLSGGDPKRVETARETILYAVIGLIVSVSAFAIVKFLVTNVG